MLKVPDQHPPVEGLKSPNRSRAATVAALKRKPKRIVLIGSTKCGKSSLIRRFLHDSFSTEYTPTIEECYSHQHTYKGIVWNLDIIDLCSPFMFPVMRDLNVKSAHIILLVYEVANKSSVQEVVNASTKIKELRPNGVTTIVVGTKIDTMLDSQASIRHGDAQTLLQQIIKDDARHLMTSSKNNIGVTDVFEMSLDDYAKNRPHSLPPEDERLDDNEKRPCCTCCSIL